MFLSELGKGRNIPFTKITGDLVYTFYDSIYLKSWECTKEIMPSTEGWVYIRKATTCLDKIYNDTLS